MSTPSSEYGYAAWIVDLLRRIGDVERARLLTDAKDPELFLTPRVVSERDEKEIAEIVNRTCAAVRAGEGFVRCDQPVTEPIPAVEIGGLLAALHRNGRKVDPEILRRLEMHRQRIRKQER